MAFTMHNELANARSSKWRSLSDRGTLSSWFFQSPGLAAWAVLAFGLLLTAILTTQYERVEHRADLWEFQDSVENMTSMIEGRLRSYSTVLNATAGMFEGKENVTPEDFELFIRRLQLETFYAGVRSIGYIQRVSPADLGALEEQLGKHPEEGYHNFQLELAEGADEHFIITHIQPLNDVYHGAVGYDLAGHPRRLRAMMRAAETGAAAATPALPLLPLLLGGDAHDAIGVAIYVPVYDGDEVSGFAFAAFSTTAVMSVVLGAFPGMGFEVYDLHEDSSVQLLYQVQPTQDGGRQLTLKRTIAVAGQTWTIVYHRPMQRDMWLPSLPIAGILVSMLLASIVWRLAKARATAADRAEQLRQHRWIIESAVDFAIFTFDLNGTINSWNSGAERVLGYAENEIIGKDVGVIFTDADQASGRPAMEREDALGDVAATDERWHVRANGERFFAVGRVMTLRDDEGNVHGFVKILHDRTSEKHAQEALQKRTAELQVSEARFRTMADSAPVFIWMADTTKAYVWFNKPWIEYTGRAMDQETGSGWIEGVHPDDVEHCRKIYSESFDARRPFKMKYRLRRHDQEYRWLLDHGVPLHGPNDTFAGYIGSCIDITDLEQARETLERYSSDLERLVNERTARLRESNEQLRISERMASLGTLAAGIGHDLGNLLLPMRIRLDIIEQNLPETEHDSVQVLRTSTEYLANLAKGLRNLSTDPDQDDSTSRKTDLDEWWKESQPLLNNTLPKNISLEADFAEDLPPLRISPAALTQSVFNLVQNSSNALRDASSGTIRVWADVDSTGKGRPRYMRVGVTDDGSGMDEEVKRRCLEPFYSTKTREFSTGLGLSLVQGAVKRAAGRMEIQSEPGKGTTIILMLPIGETESAMGEGGQRAGVLIADARIRAFVTSELEAMGYEITEGQSLTELPKDDATLWVVDANGLADEGDEQASRRKLEEFEKTMRDIVEEDDARTIVILRHPKGRNDLRQDNDDRLIRTSASFKPSEIREALRKAARNAASRARYTHGHGENNH